jgi:hypothetical protein
MLELLAAQQFQVSVLCRPHSSVQVSTVTPTASHRSISLSTIDKFSSETAGYHCVDDPAELEECMKETGSRWHNYPSSSEMEIPDPRDVIGDSYDSIRVMISGAGDMQRFAPYNPGVANHADLVDAIIIAAGPASEGGRGEHARGGQGNQLGH